MGRSSLLLFLIAAAVAGWIAWQRYEIRGFDQLELVRRDNAGAGSDGIPAAATDRESIRIASFNIQRFGPSKADNVAVMEVLARSVTFKPILAGVKYVPLDIMMAYSKGAMEGTFTYLDGTSVKLKDGVGTMEHYPRYVPNMIWITPWSLALLALLVGGRRIRMNRNDQGRVRRAVLSIVLSWLAIALLTVVWMQKG